MKQHLIYGALAAFGLISLASCSSEEDMPAPSGDGVTFTLRIPGNITTRGTFGDGADDGDRAILDNLQWTVFEVSADGSTLTKVFSDAKAGAFASNQNEETVTIKLAKGKKYQVAFYADDADNNFVTYTDGNINVDYANAASNTAAEDAFIGKSDIFTVEGAFTKTITLTRPFAQLNWGTDDLTEMSIVTLIPTLTGTVKVTQGLYTKMNVISGEVDAASAVSNPVEFAAVRFNNRPPQTFPVTKEDANAQPYELIAMNYLLTGNGTIDCELAFNNGLSPVTVSAASVKVNYRTNIYGSLLTSPGTFNILVDNNFIDNINNEVVPETADAFVAALSDPNIEEIIVTKDFDLTTFAPEELTFNTPKTINMADGTTISLGSDNYLLANAGLTLEGKGTITNAGDTNYDNLLTLNSSNQIVKSKAKKLIVVKGGDLVIKDVELVNDPDYHWHDAGQSPNQYNASTISYYGDTNVTIENASITSGGFTLCGMGACTGAVSIKNSYFESNSCNKYGHYAYALRLHGSTAVLDDVTVVGIQGGITFNTPGMQAVIKSGSYSTHNSEEGKKDAFYPIYITNDSYVTIEGGDFYGPNDWSGANEIGGTSCIVVDDDDIGKPLGHLVNILGGKFSGKAYNADQNYVYEFPYTAIENDDKYKWEIQ